MGGRVVGVVVVGGVAGVGVVVVVVVVNPIILVVPVPIQHYSRHANVDQKVDHCMD